MIANLEIWQGACTISNRRQRRLNCSLLYPRRWDVLISKTTLCQVASTPSPPNFLLLSLLFSTNPNFPPIVNQDSAIVGVCVVMTKEKLFLLILESSIVQLECEAWMSDFGASFYPCSKFSQIQKFLGHMCQQSSLMHIFWCLNL